MASIHFKLIIMLNILCLSRLYVYIVTHILDKPFTDYFHYARLSRHEYCKIGIFFFFFGCSDVVFLSKLYACFILSSSELSNLHNYYAILSIFTFIMQFCSYYNKLMNINSGKTLCI